MTVGAYNGRGRVEQKEFDSVGEVDITRIGDH